ncbi:MAG: PDZ domain-containing protein, partial [Planctomycetota bacterium]|nr:PDZ domain-containing protein [Planctomycetota bacterium]
LRRRVWIALVLFAVILMFAGWKLSPDTDEPAKLYLNFVLSATTYLMLPIAVFTAAFSLPNDIRNRTIHTITTKPVRASEIVLGRMLGFCIVMTGLLAVMGLASYIFVARGLHHTHQLDAQEMVARQTQGRRFYEGTTSLARRHRHDVRMDGESFLPEVDFVPSPDVSGVTIVELGDAAAASGLAVGDKILQIGGQPADALAGDAILDVLRGSPGSTVEMRIERNGQPRTVDVVRSVQELETSTDNGHKHRVVARWVSEGTEQGVLEYDVGPAEGMLVARVPRYGELRFHDKGGDLKDKGVNIGKIFSYRSYIQGNTLAAAIWTFDGVTPASYPEGLPLELTIRVYRSHMGKIDEGVTGSIVIRNPDTGVESREQIFTGKDFAIDLINIPRQLYDSQDNRVDLFDTLVTSDGRTEVWMRCLTPGQYFGMARADVYLSAREASYTVNFLKGLAAIWLQVMLVTGLAVLFSTFLSGPIAMLLTVTAIILGFNRGFLDHVAVSVLDPENMKELVASHERYYGGGPLEAFYRIITQNNLVTELDEGMLTTIIKKSDLVLVTCVDKMLRLMPDFEQFSEVKYLSHGYDINGHLLLQHTLTTLAFLLAAYVIGYFMLKTREMAQ